MKIQLENILYYLQIVSGIKLKITHSDAVELVLNATSNKKPLFLVKDMDEVITHIDTSDKGILLVSVKIFKLICTYIN